MKRVLVCGDRNYSHVASIAAFINELPLDCLVIEGGCQGADLIAGQCARQRGLLVDEKLAEWSKYGRAAGPIRNREMLETLLKSPIGEVKVVAFHDNIQSSKGTKNMIQQALKAGVVVELRKSDGSCSLIRSL